MDRIEHNPWSDAYMWLWYNDEEIFRYTQEDWDEKAKELHERGVTIALGFSITHFRLAYYPYWQEISECIRKIVSACHKYGIKYVEHHSTHLTHNLLTEPGWRRLEDDLLAYGAGKCSRDNWKKIFPYLTVTRTVEGKFLPDLSQINGATGEMATNVYGAYCLCFNNPDYREIYFNYMREIVKLGIDGIMNDDVQYFGDMNACTCKYCRKLFKEQYGYDLPDSEHWGEFFENYDDPAYIAWKKFKFASTTRMYRDLTKLYDELGVKLLRPNYSSDVLMHRVACGCMERCTDLWSAIFQENCFSAVMKQSYINFYTEAVHRYAAAKRSGVPAMSMFYPDREDSVYFGWALARSWGELYTGTCEGFDITGIEKPYREFEQANMKYYTAPDKIADVSFYLSMKTRDFTRDAMVKYMHKFMGGMQAAYVSGLGVDMVFETDDIEELLRHKAIVLSHVAMICDEELSNFAEYVRRGGRLVILGDFALFNEDGSPRDIADVQKKLGVEFRIDGCAKSGEGEVWRMSFEPAESEYQPSVWCNRRVADPAPVPAVPTKWEMQKAGTGAVLCGILEPKVKVSCENHRVLATAYTAGDAFVLHLVNHSDTVSEDDHLTDHKEIIKNFTKSAEKLPGISVDISRDVLINAEDAYLLTPEREEKIKLDMLADQTAVHINIPENIFSGYALITVE